MHAYGIFPWRIITSVVAFPLHLECDNVLYTELLSNHLCDRVPSFHAYIFYTNNNNNNNNDKYYDNNNDNDNKNYEKHGPFKSIGKAI